MKKLVFETLDEMLFEKELFEAEKEKAEKVTKVKQDKGEKAKQAIESLKAQLVKAKKPGAFKTTVQKNAKIKELEAKIKGWEKK